MKKKVEFLDYSCNYRLVIVVHIRPDRTGVMLLFLIETRFYGSFLNALCSVAKSILPLQVFFVCKNFKNATRRISVNLKHHVKKSTDTMCYRYFLCTWPDAAAKTLITKYCSYHQFINTSSVLPQILCKIVRTSLRSAIRNLTTFYRSESNVSDA